MLHGFRDIRAASQTSLDRSLYVRDYGSANQSSVLLNNRCPAAGLGVHNECEPGTYRPLAFAAERGLAGVTALARTSQADFSQDPRVGPWVAVIRSDPAFAKEYEDQDPGRYTTTVAGMARLLFDRDPVPGPEPEDLLRLEVPALVVPGQDASHATSAARYLEECLPRAQYRAVLGRPGQ